MTIRVFTNTPSTATNALDSIKQSDSNSPLNKIQTSKLITAEAKILPEGKSLGSMRFSAGTSRLGNLLTTFAKNAYHHPIDMLKSTSKSIWKGTAAGAVAGAIVGATGAGVGFFGGLFLGAFLGGTTHAVANTVKAFNTQTKADLLNSGNLKAEDFITRNDDKDVVQHEKTSMFFTEGKSRIKLNNIDQYISKTNSPSTIANIVLNAKNNEGHEKLNTLDLSDNKSINNKFISQLIAKASIPTDNKEELSEIKNGLDGMTLNLKGTHVSDGAKIQENLQNHFKRLNLDVEIKFTSGSLGKKSQTVNVEITGLPTKGGKASFALKVDKSFKVPSPLSPLIMQAQKVAIQLQQLQKSDLSDKLHTEADNLKNQMISNIDKAQSWNDVTDITNAIASLHGKPANTADINKYASLIFSTDHADAFKEKGLEINGMGQKLQLLGQLALLGEATNPTSEIRSGKQFSLEEKKQYIFPIQARALEALNHLKFEGSSEIVDAFAAKNKLGTAIAVLRDIAGMDAPRDFRKNKSEDGSVVCDENGRFFKDALVSQATANAKQKDLDLDVTHLMLDIFKNLKETGKL